MQDWKNIFEGSADSGILNASAGVDEAELRESAVAHGLDFTLIDLRSVSDKAGLLGEVSNVLLFPPYFGMNWDALSDCLTDLSWKAATGYVLFLVGFEAFRERAASDAAIAMRVFMGAADFWRRKGVPFYVILSE